MGELNRISVPITNPSNYHTSSKNGKTTTRVASMQRQNVCKIQRVGNTDQFSYSFNRHFKYTTRTPAKVYL